MLTAEQAHERLKEFKDPGFRQEQLARVSLLMGDLSSLGQILIQAGPAWNKVAKDSQQMGKAQYEAIERLAKLRPQDRSKLFRAIFPRLFPQIEAAWNLFDHLPYQTSYFRRPFRSPAQPSSTARAIWFQKLVYAARDYNQDVTWFAAWAPYLGYAAPDALGYLFAGAIETGGSTGQEVFSILVASANGSHTIGAMGRHVVRGLLCASRADGWDFIERMLLAAQREEGLRQVILESIDEAHPQAFRRLLRLVLEHNLSRFSAAIRAFDVWFGLAFETLPPKKVLDVLTSVLLYLDHPPEREKAVRDGSASEAYFALWAAAFDDAVAALPQVIDLRRSPDVERRFAATHLLAQMSLRGSFQELLSAMDDPDLRVAARAVTNLSAPEYDLKVVADSDLFERLERLIERLPHKENTFKPLVWDWVPLRLDRSALAGSLVGCLGSRSPKLLLPYLSFMEPVDRARAAGLLRELGKKDEETRQVLFALAGDASPYVRESALAGLKGFELSEAETERLEGLLTRRADDLRRGVIQLLLGLPDQELFQSMERLLSKKDENQRRAGLELLRECARSDRSAHECRRMAAEYQSRAVPLESESGILAEILAEEVERYSIEDALGLMDPRNRTRPHPPQAESTLFGKIKNVRLGSPAAVEILKSLDALVDKHRADAVEISYLEAKKTELLGNVRFNFPRPDHTQPVERDQARLLLRGVWENWWQTRPEALRDPDGFELLRARAILYLFHMQWFNSPRMTSEISPEMQGFLETRCDFKLNYEAVISPVLEWLIVSHPAPDEAGFLLDALEASVSRIAHKELTGLSNIYVGRDIRDIPQQKLAYLQICRWHRSFWPDAWKDEHHARLWAVVRWLDEPKGGLPRYYPQLDDALIAWRSGAATRDDLLDLLLGGREIEKWGNSFHLLRELSGRTPHPRFNEFPALKELVEECRERILLIETRRGDLPTAATVPAAALRSVPGMKNLFRLLKALGKTNFERGDYFGESRQAVLSHLVRCTYPLPADTSEDFASLASSAGIPERRMVELGVFAPQWSRFVEAAIGWPGLSEAVYWVYAHTKDRQWMVDQQIRELWAAQVSEYTPLSTDSLMDGAVDVAWFHKVFAALGEERWKAVYRAAELTATGNGHVRARIFADAMLGKVAAGDLIQRIAQKRHQDSVRALGLVPLPEGKDRQAEILRRYEALQEFRRTSKKFGSQRQASEKLAAAIAMENLARTAGFTDPLRLEWAMEVESVKDLAQGPVAAEVEGTCVSLSIDALGESQLSISRDGKPLKAIPAAIKKDERIAGLLERKNKLERQASRMRRSLEDAMCRGDAFTGAEITGLFRHPMLRAMLEQLVFAGPAGMGYPVKEGRALLTHSGREMPVAADDRLHIAHPVDLLESGDWHLWQHECFIAERIQPFKQVFRELYVLTATEKGEGNISRRYAGQQVNPRQALALFGTRGWVTDPEEGVHKTFHDLGISARVGFLQGIFTPAEVEGLTLEVVAFTRRGEWSPIALEQVAPRVFSEVMRDLDLVVSVAHAGGADPEASASSIESRSALIQETCGLLNIKNVQVKNNHALIEGKLGNYTLHLGSAVVHKQPGGALCIVPIHAQQRGRLFLPFVDNDPKTAEVISKMILLARDSEIKDPTILEQILQ